MVWGSLRFPSCFFSVSAKKSTVTAPGIGGVGGAVAVFVIGIFESVAGVIVDLYLDLFPQLIHGGSELFYVVRCDAAILCAEQAQSRSVDFFQSFRLPGQVAVVDHERGQVRFLQGQVESITSAPAPADRAQPVLAYVGLRLEELHGGVKIVLGAVFRDTSHDFVCPVGRGGHRAAIAMKIDGERDIALVCQLRGSLFHPIVEPSEFVNDYHPGEWTFAARWVENALHCFVAALVRDGLAVGGEGGSGGEYKS